MTTTIHKPVDLKITQQAWEPAIRALLLDDEAYAVGSIRWNRHAQTDEALVDAIEITRQPPTGTSRSPLDDFLIIWMDRDGLGRQVDRLARWQPRMSQAMLLLMLDGRNRQRWVGEVWREGRVERLQSWTVVGGGMLHVAHAARGAHHRSNGLSRRSQQPRRSFQPYCWSTQRRVTRDGPA